MIRVISEVGSINKAAELLNVSQPTLSKKVSRLEHKINMELFSRDSAGMAPTEAARFLLREGDELRTQLSIIERRLELMANKVGGVVRIGVGPIISQIMLPKVLLDFSEQNYQFRVSVVTLSQQALLNQLRQSEIDIAIGPFSDDEIPDEFSVPLCTSDKIVAAVREGHELASQKVISLQDVVRFKSVLPNIPKSLGQQISARVQRTSLEPDILCENYSTAKSIVANSDYITAGPETLFRQEFASGELAQLEFQTEVLWQCKCLVKPEILLSPIVKEIVAIFSQYMLPHDR
ncbi:LysR family transcriptional regulator [Marinobacter xestospongiae]|uniref:LysR family transcriptional regulator n=1 Tax=Marinobacter xestospongiae TaxID=994319 RepID=UPI00200661C3|nr:LysR family transcriptional regulator [Marinobacter xestospongiae]MCK7568635.1 LysR family transcriptional regulator [Marinobacter xestospongiae]